MKQSMIQKLVKAVFLQNTLTPFLKLSSSHQVGLVGALMMLKNHNTCI